jgi:hypothetical protein
MNTGTPAGSAQHEPLPSAGSHQHAPITVNSGPAAVLDASGTFLSRMAHFSPQQAQTAAVLVLTLFVCAVLGWQMYAGRQVQAETLGLVIRSMESESEKNRAANASEFSQNRASFSAEARSNREAFADNTKLTIASHQKLAQELGKLEQVVSGLNSAIVDLRKKLPPEETSHTAPPPRSTGPRDGTANSHPPARGS